VVRNFCFEPPDSESTAGVDATAEGDRGEFWSSRGSTAGERCALASTEGRSRPSRETGRALLVTRSTTLPTGVAALLTFTHIYGGLFA
jgi:hypothetical protein